MQRLRSHISSLRLPLLLTCLLVALSGCDKKKAAPSESTHPTGSLRLHVAAPPDAGQTVAAKVSVTSGRLKITGEGMSTIDTLLAVRDGLIEGTIRGIPVGPRTVELILQDSGGNRLWDASATVTIVKDEAAEAVLRLSRFGDAPPQITSIEVTPEAAPVDSTFRFTIGIEDIHDPTDSLEVRWDFDGDGSFDDDWTFNRAWEHTYQTEGAFTAVAQVRDRSDSIGTASQPVEAFRLVAIAGAIAGQDTVSALLADDRVSLDASRSTATSGREVIYHWSQVLDMLGAKDVSVLGTFSDNHSPDASRVSFSSETEGRGLYVFVLQIEDQQTGALSNTDTLYVLVSSQAPTVSVVDPPTTVALGDPVTLLAEGSDPDGDEVLYRWRGEHVHLLSDSTSAETIFTPDEEREYRFSVVAIDADPQQSVPVEVVIQGIVPDEVLSFADLKLEAAVRETIGKPEGDILPEDVVSLTFLTATGLGISDLGGIESLSGLTTLSLHQNQISDLTVLGRLTSLRDLRLWSNQIEDISVLSSLKALDNLEVGLNRIADISVIPELESLDVLSIHNNRLTDIGPIADHPDLTRLDITRNQIEDLTPLADLVFMDGLWVSDNPLTDISPLSGLFRLRFLISDRTQLREISALSELTALDSLTLEDNLVSDLSALVTNTGLRTGDHVDLRGNPLSEDAVNTQIPALQARGVVVLFDAPAEPESAPITFADPNLEAAVREAISKPTGDILTDDVAELRDLDAKDRDIVDLAGIESLTSLEIFDVIRNRISDISALAGLTSLARLEISQNTIRDVEALLNLRSLGRLNASFNQIQDLSPLAPK